MVECLHSVVRVPHFWLEVEVVVFDVVENIVTERGKDLPFWSFRVYPVLLV